MISGLKKCIAKMAGGTVSPYRDPHTDDGSSVPMYAKWKILKLTMNFTVA